MKLTMSFVVMPLFFVVSTLQAQPVSELSPQDFVDVVTGDKQLPPGVVVFTVDKDVPPPAATNVGKPLLSLPAYGGVINTGPLAQADAAIASTTGLYFNGLYAKLLLFGLEDAARLEATNMNNNIDLAIELVSYSEALVLHYRKTFNRMIVKICSEYDTHVVSRGEENAIKLFDEAFDASQPFISQFYLDAFVDLDRHLDPVVVTHAVAEITKMASTWEANSILGENHVRPASSAIWINGYCAARLDELEKLENAN
ncbi:MAG: hypothetical protein V4628_14650 [Pseudomonadota bacterium]